MCKTETLKMDFCTKNKLINIHLYFIATKYLLNNEFVEYIDI